MITPGQRELPRHKSCLSHVVFFLEVIGPALGNTSDLVWLSGVQQSLKEMVSRYDTLETKDTLPVADSTWRHL